MKIAQVTHNYLPHIGGMEFYVKRVVDSLNKKNISPVVLTTDMGTSKTGRKEEALYFKTSVAVMRNPLSLRYIQHLKGNSYDILHLHSVWFLHSLPAVYFRKKARVISTIHGVFPDNAGWKLKLFLNLYKPFVRYVLKKSERIFVYSSIEEQKLKRIFNLSSQKITVLPMAINIEEYKSRPKEKIILFTGRIIPDKNPDLLIKAAGLLDSKFNSFKLVFVGAVKEDYKKELIDLSRQLGIKNEILFVGQLDPSVPHEKQKLMNYYRNAWVFVSLGSWEGQPTRIMEAMQFETPVIAFAAGGTEDFVVHNVNGLVIDKLDEKMLAANLEKLLEDEAFSKKLGTEARLTMEKGYNWEKIFEHIYQVYKA
jgi:glycosyltransferase involved in cell wall biosynthesis